ncbi:MAG TPA: hypothetical protein VK149_08405 [Sideroxyarcus sp.]|nr:hypothetical protein [Sideroxyarcus sp.]
MKSSRLFLLFYLVLALLFTQLGGLTHGIAHTLAEQSQDQSLPHDQHCELCAAYAQVGSALGSSDIQFDFASNLEETSSSLSVTFHSAAFSAFAARAPPRSA